MICHSFMQGNEARHSLNTGRHLHKYVASPMIETYPTCTSNHTRARQGKCKCCKCDDPRPERERRRHTINSGYKSRISLIHPSWHPIKLSNTPPNRPNIQSYQLSGSDFCCRHVSKHWSVLPNPLKHYQFSLLAWDFFFFRYFW